MDHPLSTKNNKPSNTVSKTLQQLQRHYDIACAGYFRPGYHISFRWLATAITRGNNRDYMISNNNNMLSYVIRREERFALKERSLTADKKRSWFEPTITLVRHYQGDYQQCLLNSRCLVRVIKECPDQFNSSTALRKRP